MFLSHADGSIVTLSSTLHSIVVELLTESCLVDQNDLQAHPSIKSPFVWRDRFSLVTFGLCPDLFA